MTRFAALALLLAACGDDSPVHHLPDAPRGNAPPGIYVSNFAGAITVYPLDAVGNAAPMRTITGAATGLGGSIGINVDSDGFIYVANRSQGTVTVYPKDVDGNAAPTRTLMGLGAPEVLAITADDELLVASCHTCNSDPGDDKIFHFAKGAATSDSSLGGAPNTNTLLHAPGSVGLDPSDNTLWVANSYTSLVESFPAGASGDVAPARSFNAMLGNLQSATFADNALFIASPDAGLINIFSTSGTGTPTPVVIPNHMNGLDVGYPAGLWVETSSGHPVIYLADTDGAIHIIDTTGTTPNLSVASVKTITGAATSLATPLGVRVIP
ncbi:MAG TPA: hypothetical protein VGM90_34965 [Kofleriaceae bacterium]|jgi:hypothetical protein